MIADPGIICKILYAHGIPGSQSMFNLRVQMRLLEVKKETQLVFSLQCVWALG